MSTFHFFNAGILLKLYSINYYFIVITILCLIFKIIVIKWSADPWQVWLFNFFMNNPEQVANSFINAYYQAFVSNRAGISAFYHESATLTMEGSVATGPANIGEKLSNLPITNIQPEILTCDSQFSSPQGNIMIMVTGNIAIDHENKQRFSQSFQLLNLNGNYAIFNDIFRLNYG